MLQKLSLLAFLFVVFSFGCNESTTNSETSEAAVKEDNMAKFTEDEEFKKAHETPKKMDFAPRGIDLKYPTPDGKEGSAYALLNEKVQDKFVFVIHEWWGLNDHIKQEAERLFDELGNVNVLALDLYDGNVTDKREEAGEFMQAVKEERAKAIIQGALNRIGKEASVATIGWCFGGGWSLKSSILAGKQGKACVIYYGLPVKTAAELAPLEAPVMGIFAKNEKWINPDVVKEFEGLAAATKKNLVVHSFDADHAFANPSSERYVEDAAQEANQLSLEFIKENL